MHEDMLFLQHIVNVQPQVISVYLYRVNIRVQQIQIRWQVIGIPLLIFNFHLFLAAAAPLFQFIKEGIIFRTAADIQILFGITGNSNILIAGIRPACFCIICFHKGIYIKELNYSRIFIIFLLDAACIITTAHLQRQNLTVFILINNNSAFSTEINSNNTAIDVSHRISGYPWFRKLDYTAIISAIIIHIPQIPMTAVWINKQIVIIRIKASPVVIAIQEIIDQILYLNLISCRSSINNSVIVSFIHKEWLLTIKCFSV